MRFFGQFHQTNFGPPSLLVTRSLRWRTRHCKINVGNREEPSIHETLRQVNIADPDPASIPYAIGH